LMSKPILLDMELLKYISEPYYSYMPPCILGHGSMRSAYFAYRFEPREWQSNCR